MIDGVVISLFDRTCNMVKPWSEAGYTCYCVDIQHAQGETREGNIIKVGCDIFNYELPQQPVKIVFAFPPCTDIAVSGAKHFQSKGLKRLIKALQLFDRAIDLCEGSGKPYAIENPVSVISSYYRKPDFTFHPWQYGDLYYKRTCLWVGGYAMPDPFYDTEPEGVTDKIFRMPPSGDRGDLRAETPMGFARAVFDANRVQTFERGKPLTMSAKNLRYMFSE